jgi:shikimate kinase
MPSSIILIGPMRAGKTTIGTLLAQSLNIPQVSLDRVRDQYYRDMGYDNDHARKLQEEGGAEARLSYLKPFEVQLAERILNKYPDRTVIDFGAGHSVYKDPILFERIRKALEPFRYVFFLTPSDDVEEALQILNQRDLDDMESGLPEMNREFVTSPANRTLAKFIIYNQDKTPQQTHDEIVSLLK